MKFNKPSHHYPECEEIEGMIRDKLNFYDKISNMPDGVLNKKLHDLYKQLSVAYGLLLAVYYEHKFCRDRDLIEVQNIEDRRQRWSKYEIEFKEKLLKKND